MTQEQTTEERREDLEQDIAALAQRALDTIEEFVVEQPHAALGIAAVAGFVLGGGLTPRRLLRLGLAAGGPALSRQLVDRAVRVATEAFESEKGSSTSRRTVPRRKAKSENGE
jgi:hypothetical protein